MTTHYTYLWRDNAGVPFYVGKGRDKRAFDTYHRSKEFKQIYAKGGCVVEIVNEFSLESEAHALEIELISRYGRRDSGTGLLINKTDGGEGISGLVRTAEHCAKLSAAGRNMSAEVRAKISEATRNSRNAEYSANLSAAHSNRSAEYRAKLSAANKGRTRSAEARANMSAAHRGKKHNAETRAKMSEAQRKRHLNKRFPPCPVSLPQ